MNRRTDQNLVLAFIAVYWVDNEFLLLTRLTVLYDFLKSHNVRLVKADQTLEFRVEFVSESGSFALALPEDFGACHVPTHHLE